MSEFRFGRSSGGEEAGIPVGQGQLAAPVAQFGVLHRGQEPGEIVPKSGSVRTVAHGTLQGHEHSGGLSGVPVKGAQARL